MISVIVCTYNRKELVDECIQSLLKQETDIDYEIVVVDNNSADDTEGLLELYSKKFSNFNFVVEEKQGLSNARNAGFHSAKYDWVAYVDDDAKAHKDFVEVAYQVIKEGEFDCFGGIYNAWFKYGRPDWIPENFGSNRHRMPKQKGVMETQRFSGGVAVYKRKLLEDMGGFPTDFGMKGDSIAYGEEDFVQIKARENGYIIGFVPKLQIDHLVREDKLKKSWHYKDAYQKGIAKAKLEKDINWKLIKSEIFWFIKQTIRLMLNISLFKGIKNIFFYKGYFKQAWTLKFFQRIKR